VTTRAKEGALLTALNLAAAVAGRTDNRLGRRFGAGAVTVVTGFHTRHFKLSFGAEGCLFKCEPHIGAQIGAPSGLASRAGGPTAAETAKEILKDTAEIAEAAAEVVAEAAGAFEPGMAEAIIGRTLLVVVENLVGLVDLLKIGLSLRRLC
jgi:hypothetical protein